MYLEDNYSVVRVVGQLYEPPAPAPPTPPTPPHITALQTMSKEEAAAQHVQGQTYLQQQYFPQLNIVPPAPPVRDTYFDAFPPETENEWGAPRTGHRVSFAIHRVYQGLQINNEISVRFNAWMMFQSNSMAERQQGVPHVMGVLVDVSLSTMTNVLVVNGTSMGVLRFNLIECDVDYFILKLPWQHHSRNRDQMYRCIVSRDNRYFSITVPDANIGWHFNQTTNLRLNVAMTMFVVHKLNIEGGGIVRLSEVFYTRPIPERLKDSLSNTLFCYVLGYIGGSLQLVQYSEGPPQWWGRLRAANGNLLLFIEEINNDPLTQLRRNAIIRGIEVTRLPDDQGIAQTALGIAANRNLMTQQGEIVRQPLPFDPIVRRTRKRQRQEYEEEQRVVERQQQRPRRLAAPPFVPTLTDPGDLIPRNLSRDEWMRVTQFLSR
jgi:hypothetical protein